MFKNISIIGMILGISLAYGQQKIAPKGASKQTHSVQVTEITDRDLTKVEELRSTKLTVFGIRLGQTKDEARSAAESARMTWKMVAMAEGDPMPAVFDESGHQLLHLDLSAEGLVTRIRLKPSISRYLAGDGKRLFADDILDPASSTRMELLGHEDQYQHDPWQTLDGEYRRFQYFKEGIEVAGTVPANSIIPMEVQLFPPAKQRQ